jgi:hypothetical protein
VTARTTRRAGIIPARDIPPGPRGLAGYCWVQDPKTGVHCCEPVGHESKSRQHVNPYAKQRWM